MILRVISAKYLSGHSFRVAFNDGTEGTVDLLPLLEGPALEPLRDKAFVATASVDSRRGVLTWPGDIDLAPECVHVACNIEVAG